MHKTREKGLSASLIKLIAILAMTLDHIAWAFLPTEGLAGQSLHFLGRTTLPVMCFFLTEGYHHTHSRRRYFVRMGVFAVISHFAFVYFETGNPFTKGCKSSVILTLSWCLAALEVYNGNCGSLSRNREHPEDGQPAVSFRLPCIAIIAVLAQGSDWGMNAVIFTMVFEIARLYGTKKQTKAYLLAALCYLMQAWGVPGHLIISGRLYILGIFLPVLLLMPYNGKRGGEKFRGAERWFFYIYYPAHLVILGILKYVVFA